MYGRSLETPYSADTPRRRAVNVPVVEVIWSPIIPETLHSEASLWSFTPLSIRSALTTSSIHPSDTTRLRPRSAEPSTTASTMSGLFRDNQQMGLPLARSVDAYSHNSMDDLSSIEYFDDDDNDFGPVDYNVRRQTNVRTANIHTLPDSGLFEQRIAADEEDFSPVQYTERRQTNVHTASLKTMESPRRVKRDINESEIGVEFPSSYDVVDFENVEISHRGGEAGGNTSSRPRLQTDFRSARIIKQEAKKQRKRESKKKKSRSGSRKSDKQSPEERENYRTPSIKRRANKDEPEYLSKY